MRGKGGRHQRKICVLARPGITLASPKTGLNAGRVAVYGARIQQPNKAAEQKSKNGLTAGCVSRKERKGNIAGRSSLDLDCGSKGCTHAELHSIRNSGPFWRDSKHEPASRAQCSKCAESRTSCQILPALRASCPNTSE